MNVQNDSENLESGWKKYAHNYMHAKMHFQPWKMDLQEAMQSLWKLNQEGCVQCTFALTSKPICFFLLSTANLIPMKGWFCYWKLFTEGTAEGHHYSWVVAGLRTIGGWNGKSPHCLRIQIRQRLVWVPGVWVYKKRRDKVFLGEKAFYVFHFIVGETTNVSRDVLPNWNEVESYKHKVQEFQWLVV